MTFTHALGTNNYGPAKFIVDANAANGTHTTIATALTSSTSGDTIFIRPGTYTENLTLKAGVNLTAFGSDSSSNQTGKVIISGTCTLTTAGSVTISGIQLQTNSAALLAVTGSVASIVNLQNCNLNCTNNTGITFSSSSASAAINITNCFGDLGTTGIGLFTHTSAGTLTFINCNFKNTGGSSTASTASAGTLQINYSVFNSPITTSSTNSIGTNGATISTSAQNVTALTVGGTGGLGYDTYASGTASAISVGGSLGIAHMILNSTNTNAITGAGTITYSDVVYTGSSHAINTTTQARFLSTDFSSINVQTFTSSGTYTPTAGMLYCNIICLGGGGGSGGCQASGAGQVSASTGGAAGEYAEGIFTAASIGASKTVTIGAAGAAGVGNAAGGAGGTTSVGALITAVGGSGGAAGATATSPAQPGAAGGTGGSGGDFRSPGFSSASAWGAFAVTLITPSNGANSQFGSGGLAGITGTSTVGSAGLGFGSGGGGSSLYQSQAAINGAVGTKGIVIITEYI